MAKKCTKNYSARTQLLFYSSNLLFDDVLVAVAVMFCVRSLVTCWQRVGNLSLGQTKMIVNIYLSTASKKSYSHFITILCSALSILLWILVPFIYLPL